MTAGDDPLDSRHYERLLDEVAAWEHRSMMAAVLRARGVEPPERSAFPVPLVPEAVSDGPLGSLWWPVFGVLVGLLIAAYMAPMLVVMLVGWLFYGAGRWLSV